MTELQRHAFRLIDEYKNRQYVKIGGRYASKLPGDAEPVLVRQARKIVRRQQAIIQRHERLARRRRDKAEAIINKRVSDLKTLVLTGQTKRALAIIGAPPAVTK